MSRKGYREYEKELLEQAEPIVKQFNKGWIDADEANKRLRALSDRFWKRAAIEKGRKGDGQKKNAC